MCTSLALSECQLKHIWLGVLHEPQSLQGNMTPDAREVWQKGIIVRHTLHAQSVQQGNRFRSPWLLDRYNVMAPLLHNTGCLGRGHKLGWYDIQPLRV
jgi:hypothetical protein